MQETLDKTGERWEDRDTDAVLNAPAVPLTSPADEVSKTMAPNESTTPSKSPAFQFYPNDFLGDGKQAAMSLQECGLYIRLLCRCWNDGAIPDDTVRLARMVGANDSQVLKLWPAVRECFQDRGDGWMIHGRLDKERAKQDRWRDKSAAGGRRSQAKRNHQPTTLEPPLQPKVDSSSSSSSSSSDQKHTSASVFGFPEKARATKGETEAAMRAGDFIVRYKALHVRLRNGARYVGPRDEHLDFQEARFLAGIYDDARLDKLAFVWLNTDHEFAEKGSRTIAKFRSMVSWCEEQLIAWEQKHGRELVVAS